MYIAGYNTNATNQLWSMLSPLSKGNLIEFNSICIVPGWL